MPPSKTQRWLDLIAVLLGRRFPVSVEFILQQVPAYRADLEAVHDADEETRDRAMGSVRRKFERDKRELRGLGIPLETVSLRMPGGEPGEGYRIPSAGFYLPLLRVVTGSDSTVTSDAARAPGTGVGSHTVELTENEARTALSALRRILELPAFPLEREARTALGKLTFDLDPALDEALPIRVLERAGGADPARLLPLLMEALLERKRLSLSYRGPRDAAQDAPRPRDVEPWGIFFQWGAWYLLGHDPRREPPVRLYRVDRILGAGKNAARPGTADFERDPAFDVSRWMDRSAWELGAGDAEVQAIRVRFRPPLDQLADRNDWGEAVPAADPDALDGAVSPGSVREFPVRSRAPFLRWVLSHGGEAEVVAPPEAVDELRALAARIAARHAPAGETS
jgi:predicted DNA-binding transcriptional regulator YafY